jgi:hypothetical protein
MAGVRIGHHRQGMYRLYAELHRNILDVFNEYGVQIVTPRYEADPLEPKLVRSNDWYAAPARPPASRSPLLTKRPSAKFTDCSTPSTRARTSISASPPVTPIDSMYIGTSRWSRRTSTTWTGGGGGAGGGDGSDAHRALTAAATATIVRGRT